MTDKPAPQTSTEVIAERVRQEMNAKGWTAQHLLDALAGAGLLNATWSASVVANLTSGRRRYITVDELYALAYVLDVSPLHLMVPISPPAGDKRTRLAIVATQAAQPTTARAWIRGLAAIGAQDPRRYFSQVPAEEWQPPGGYPWTPQDVAEQGKTIRKERNRGQR